MGAEIHVAHGGAGAHVAGVPGARHHRPHLRHPRRLLHLEGGREPAVDDGIGYRPGAALAHRLDAVVPEARRAGMGGGVREHETGEPLRRVQRQPLAHHPAERQAAEIGGGDIEAIHQSQHVAAEIPME